MDAYTPAFCFQLQDGKNRIEEDPAVLEERLRQWKIYIQRTGCSSDRLVNPSTFAGSWSNGFDSTDFNNRLVNPSSATDSWPNGFDSTGGSNSSLVNPSTFAGSWSNGFDSAFDHHTGSKYLQKKVELEVDLELESVPPEPERPSITYGESPTDFCFPILPSAPKESRFRRKKLPPPKKPLFVRSPKKSNGFFSRMRESLAKTPPHQRISFTAKPNLGTFQNFRNPENFNSRAAFVQNSEETAIAMRKESTESEKIVEIEEEEQSVDSASVGGDDAPPSETSNSSGVGSLEEDTENETKNEFYDSQSALSCQVYTRIQYEKDRKRQIVEEKNRKAAQEARELEERLAGLRKQFEIEERRLEQTRRRKPRKIPPPPRSKSELIANGVASTLFPEHLATARKTILDRFSASAGLHATSCQCPCGVATAVTPRPSRIIVLSPDGAIEKVAVEENCKQKLASVNAIPVPVANRFSYIAQKRRVTESDGYESEEF